MTYSKEEYTILREMCRYSNNLYNAALYNIRQYYLQEKKFLKYEENYHVCKENENYGLLQIGVSQQTLKVADRSFKSFFNLIKKAKSGEYRFKGIKMPHYREKGGMFNPVLSTNVINIKDGFLTIPMGLEFSKLHGGKHVRILLAIDIGLENLATCVTNTGTAFIMDGRKLKSINRYWNKQKAYCQCIADKQGQKKTQRLYALSRKRNNRTQDYIRKVARYIVNYCIEHRIGTIVCGYNGDFKRSMKLGRTTNQQFTQISFGSLREALAGLCERYGVQYIEQEESYTSKASCLDLDDIPVYNPEQAVYGNLQN